MDSHTGLHSKSPFVYLLLAWCQVQTDLKLAILPTKYWDYKHAILHSPWPSTLWVAEGDLKLLMLLRVTTTSGLVWC